MSAVFPDPVISDIENRITNIEAAVWQASVAFDQKQVQMKEGFAMCIDIDEDKERREELINCQAPLKGYQILTDPEEVHVPLVDSMPGIVKTSQRMFVIS